MAGTRPTDGSVDLLRAALGGLLMGLANLVPGISGGTMLLATGIYPRFIVAVSEVTRLVLRASTIAFLCVVGGVAAAAVVLLAGPVRDAVVGHRWGMYSLFIGLTLGGIPVLWRLAGRASRSLAFGAAGGFLAMVVLAVIQRGSADASAALTGNPALLLIAGIAGSASMILPGISGGYMLLVLGQYLPILSAIDVAQRAARVGDLGVLLDVGVRVFLPVTVGIIIGVAVVSNLLRYLLQRHERATLGVLLGLLLGAVVGLWPFQQGILPTPGETVIQGQVVTEESLAEIDLENWPVEFFRPTPRQAAASMILIAVGAAVTLAIARIGRNGETEGNDLGSDDHDC